MERGEEEFVETHPILHHLATSCRIKAIRWLAASAITQQFKATSDSPWSWLAIHHCAVRSLLLDECTSKSRILFSHVKAGWP